MKNILKLSVLSLSIAGLASCSTLGLDSLDKVDPSTGQSVNTEQTTDTVNYSDSTEVSTPTATIKLKKNNQNQIIATIYTSYNNNPQGSVKLEWKAPEKSNCYNTSFPITKYNEKNDKTWASVEIKQSNKECTGEWIANVVYDGNVIASNSTIV